MIEAMACGTPVIAWRKGSVPEVVRDGLTGFVVDDIEAAVRCLPRLETIRRQDCRRIFEDHFRAERMATDYLRIYQRLIQNTADSVRMHPER
jgi:glycosyltransferase involved in cell wall biosynthesis